MVSRGRWRTHTLFEKSRGRSSRCGGLSVVSLYISCMGWVGEWGQYVICAVYKYTFIHSLTKMSTVKLSPTDFDLLFLVTRKTIERKNISLFHRDYVEIERQWFARVKTRLSAWTTSRMRKVWSSRPWLFSYFQLSAPIFSLPLDEFFF